MLVPDEAIDQCETSYKAADGKKQKAAMDSFDDTGIMALICHHDIPLFFANIDTPGEQQKYSVVLIEHLFSLIPIEANVVILYDVGCVLARSLMKYDILSHNITSRIWFATTAMHAYGHEWACQLVYNPRIVKGLGLSDGEGTERLWSRFIRLIGIERSSSRQRRIWLIDRHAASIAKDMVNNLGDWLRCRLKKGIQDQGSAAQKTELDGSERALQGVRVIVEKSPASQGALDALASLERGHERLLHKVDTLYASLNIQDRFPELDGVCFEFVQTLLLARDLKINIRKRAIGSFFEWDKLDRAVGGKQKALGNVLFFEVAITVFLTHVPGTKLHQQTRKAIAKRQPALMSAIRKFNHYCALLEDLYDPSYAIPLPTPLPTKLVELRNDQTLLEDVWITRSHGEIPLWLEDYDQERCREEQLRLGIEADNLCRWFGRELCAVELALRQPQHSIYYLILKQCHEAVRVLQDRWPSLFVSAARYAGEARAATDLAASLSGSPSAQSLQWLTPMVCELPSDSHTEVDSPETTTDAEPEDLGQIMLRDHLLENVSNEAEDFSNKDEDEEPMMISLDWQIPPSLRVDSTINISTTHYSHPCTVRTPCVRAPCDGFPRQMFEPDDTSLLSTTNACLNDTCINGCGALLFSTLLSAAAQRCAILSTHDLPRVRYNATDEILWRNASWSRYWEKDIWIIPIHRPSLAERKPWKKDVQDIAQLITRFSRIASDRVMSPTRDLSAWSAQPVITEPVQSNNHDCGLWVLAQTAAALRGFDLTGNAILVDLTSLEAF
ncbi:hypothetical protein PISMIDRAFT_20060 [Pisolithus microcarpus 441]|uniref:Unplaced genomic scaffold scaffold_725, whole genome shotgun sequence n=1 Tax=Pisolithus microcarpus 441 TaxID=765257 RepID=A0A0C9XEV4_9AGAM|nr:hypothetical protein PISMIDRAFT_20060 [Pisolithus microcarpus 441]